MPETPETRPEPPAGPRRRGFRISGPPSGEHGWTQGSTLAAALAVTIAYPWLLAEYRFGDWWQVAILTACLALLAGGFWRQGLKLVIGGGVALALHAHLAAFGALPPWQPVVAAALAGLVALCLWRLLAVAGAVVAGLVVVRLLHDGVPPELILEAIRIQLE